ncbi:hypothetical protein [Mycolicibacter sinensis]|uniref:Uncharacterized protein n=1 Tax=Mycolicibacter sinensis (strain JDM601) TaxID=875328 RepID=A0A1A3TLT9_MYCSD|nr:hypothetical protein [Mycolicibacter sinensis]OBK83641.1 hypothetical protein A5648_11530 [Mycolicibacter sinensis]
MTNAEGLPPTEGVPEADLAEQRIDTSDEDHGLDPADLENVNDIEANPADLIEQATSVPLPDEDYDSGQ